MEPTRVLFLCTGNSARSLMAEALLRDLSRGFSVFSAGTEPKGVHPYTLKVLEQDHLPTEGLHSKSVSDFIGQQFEYVITVCDSAAEVCPTFPGTPERIHWSFADPAAVEGSELEKLAAFQKTLRELRRRIALFAAVAR